jgi:hypothetical protein
VSGVSTFIEAAHTNAVGAKGMSQKTSDFSAIPLCSAHHRVNPDSYHRLGEKRFVQEQQLELPELVTALNSRFRQLVLDQPHHLTREGDRREVPARYTGEKPDEHR